MEKTIEMQNYASEYERNELEEKIKAKGEEWAEKFNTFCKKVMKLSDEEFALVCELLTNYQSDPQAACETFKKKCKIV